MMRVFECAIYPVLVGMVMPLHTGRTQEKVALRSHGLATRTLIQKEAGSGGKSLVQKAFPCDYRSLSTCETFSSSNSESLWRNAQTSLRIPGFLAVLRINLVLVRACILVRTRMHVQFTEHERCCHLLRHRVCTVPSMIARLKLFVHGAITSGRVYHGRAGCLRPYMARSACDAVESSCD